MIGKNVLTLNEATMKEAEMMDEKTTDSVASVLNSGLGEPRGCPIPGACSALRHFADTERLRYMMREGCDGFGHVANDRYEYAMLAAAINGREEPNANDELEGYRMMIDCAMDGGDTTALDQADT